jgi:transcriptional regulator with XRE-family HTH domain
MSRPSAKPKTAVQQAIVDLRRQLGLTQLELALALDVTPITITRWETSYPPRENGLFKLATFAHQRGEIVWASIFNGALEQAEETRYSRQLRVVDDSLDFEAAISNIYRAVRASPNPRLRNRWIRVLEALVPAHRLVIQSAISNNQAVQEMVERDKFSPGEAALVTDSVRGLRDLDRRLGWHLKEARSARPGLRLVPRQEAEKAEQSTVAKPERKSTKRKLTK